MNFALFTFKIVFFFYNEQLQTIPVDLISVKRKKWNAKDRREPIGKSPLIRFDLDRCLRAHPYSTETFSAQFNWFWLKYPLVFTKGPFERVNIPNAIKKCFRYSNDFFNILEVILFFFLILMRSLLNFKY